MLSIWGKTQPEKASTQEILQLAEIHDGVVITKTGALRAVLMISSINFALKSEQEQTAIIYAYQNFLNSLDFPIQIVMQSKTLDLYEYIKKLKAATEGQTNELLRLQMMDYADFIERLITIANIMDKKFFVVVSFAPPPKIGPSGGSFFSKNRKNQNSSIQMTTTEFATYKEELTRRIQVIQSGLGSVGLRSAPLNTQQIIELLYGIYNPEEAAKEKLAKVEELTSQIVESEIEKPVEDKKAEVAK